MATAREQPYSQFNFLVDLGEGEHAGFQECSFAGANSSTQVTLKRGIINSLYLVQWVTDIGNRERNAVRDVLIHLQGEDHTVVQTWKLLRTRVIKHIGGPMNAKDADVAIEELTLAYERLEISEPAATP